MGTPETHLRLRKTDQNPSADQNSLSSSSSPGRAPIGSDYNRPIFKLGIVSLSMRRTPQQLPSPQSSSLTSSSSATSSPPSPNPRTSRTTIQPVPTCRRRRRKTPDHIAHRLKSISHLQISRSLTPIPMILNLPPPPNQELST
ncbi:hypothetical protein PGTUg99_012941 [Puccinia graminis f. sp. tritici]|uniref:Uncharacterized protein n=1 Tax=Puccinia graminis f. sp. tritici TaxID=56615 RepID=A0A5B0RHM7_PUCGR|nr:hypothetical protein PGTUg99_012941 [Puccinia graminis f. sp. tritici]